MSQQPPDPNQPPPLPPAIPAPAESTPPLPPPPAQPQDPYANPYAGHAPQQQQQPYPPQPQPSPYPYGYPAQPPAAPQWGQDPYANYAPPPPQTPYPAPQTGYAPYGDFKPKANAGQSRGGIVSILLAVLGLATMFGGMVWMMQYITPGQMPDPNNPDPRLMLPNLLILGSIVLQFLGIVAAALGFFEKDRGRATCWVGIALNGVPCCGFGVLTILGLAMFASALGGGG